MMTGAASNKTVPSLQRKLQTTVSFGAPSEKLSLPDVGEGIFFAGKCFNRFVRQSFTTQRQRAVAVW